MNLENGYALPNLKEVFDRLRRGRHICAEDGVLYHALRDNTSAFSDLFKQLGFRLENHPKEFYYFHGEGDLSETTSRMAVFVFILMEFLANQGEAVEQGIITKTFALEELPHLKSERYRTYMKEAGIEDEEDLVNVVNNLERYGFAQKKQSSFRFRAPIYRFFDVCHRILKLDENAQTVGDDNK